jgi:hypothetical protein
MRSTSSSKAGFVSGLVEDVQAVAAVLSSPSRLRAKISEFSERRKDRKIEARLNGQIRKQFITAYEASDKDEFSVKTSRTIEDYKSRNGPKSWLLKPYEAFSHWNIPSKIVTGLGLFKGASYLLAPIIGAWSLAVPMTGMIVSRMALTYKDAKNLRQEQLLAKNDEVAPIRVCVTGGALIYNGINVSDNFKVAFPVQFTKTPTWLASDYLKDKQQFSKPQRQHGFVHELSLRPQGQKILDQIKTDFSADEDMQNMAALLVLLFPKQNTAERTALIKNYASQVVNTAQNDKKTGLKGFFAISAQAERADIAMHVAIVKAFEPFAKRNLQGQGLSRLANVMTKNDVEYLAHMLGRDMTLRTEQAELIQDSYRKAAKYKALNFTERVEIALYPKHTQTMLLDLWDDSKIRQKFGFGALKDIVQNYDGWGNTALKLNTHDYAQGLSAVQIMELAQTENAHWAQVYHELKTAPELDTAHLSHIALKNLTLQFGKSAKEKLLREAPNTETGGIAAASQLLTPAL